eukprot:1057766-Rhodomonas_salina.1
MNGGTKGNSFPARAKCNFYCTATSRVAPHSGAEDAAIPGTPGYPGTRVLPTVPDLITNAEILARKAQYKTRAGMS